MIIGPTITQQNDISVSCLMNNKSYAHIANDITNSWGGGNVIFGSEQDPFANAYGNFVTMVNDIVDAGEQVSRVYDLAMGNSDIRLISDVDDLSDVPAYMRPYILQDPTIRKHHENGTIYGWGIEPKCVAEEDVIGRMYNNGFMEFNGDEFTNLDDQEYYSYEWTDEDPDIDEEAVDVIYESRQFIARQIEEQLESEMLDPTDWKMQGKMSKLK